VIVASNRDLERAVKENAFRQDLYYRLAIISIFLPPLGDRKDDILPLVGTLSIAITGSFVNRSRVSPKTHASYC